MHNATDIKFLRLSNEVAKRAIALGNHPFGAVLVAPDNETVLLTQCNIDTVNHAESTLARIAALGMQRQTWHERPRSNTTRPFSSDARW